MSNIPPATAEDLDFFRTHCLVDTDFWQHDEATRVACYYARRCAEAERLLRRWLDTPHNGLPAVEIDTDKFLESKP